MPRSTAEIAKREAGGERALRAVPVDDETGEGLADSGDDEEGGGESAGLGEAHAELGHEPREERRDDEVEEVGGGVGEADHRHHFDVARARFHVTSLT
ncbi:MAG: hypothetical protein LC689_10275 [Myxococcales bacterium]|nr:hypothetical protein [Myxococcales bacterium]